MTFSINNLIVARGVVDTRQMKYKNKLKVTSI